MSHIGRRGKPENKTGKKVRINPEVPSGLYRESFPRGFRGFGSAFLRREFMEKRKADRFRSARALGVKRYAVKYVRVP